MKIRDIGRTKKNEKRMKNEILKFVNVANMFKCLSGENYE